MTIVEFLEQELAAALDEGQVERYLSILTELREYYGEDDESDS